MCIVTDKRGVYGKKDVFEDREWHRFQKLGSKDYILVRAQSLAVEIPCSFPTFGSFVPKGEVYTVMIFDD